jgi:proline dehydrogenase
LAILANASERPDHPETWTELNARRLALIRKRYGVGLNELEENELKTLQDAAAKVFEPADRRRWEYVQALVQDATGSTDE